MLTVRPEFQANSFGVLAAVGVPHVTRAIKN